jgi:hypothetical protein
MFGYEAEPLDNTIETWGNLVHPEDKDHALGLIQDHREGRT